MAERPVAERPVAERPVARRPVAQRPVAQGLCGSRALWVKGYVALGPTRIFCRSKIYWNRISHWLPIIFHFGTENWEEQLKKHPVVFT